MAAGAAVSQAQASLSIENSGLDVGLERHNAPLDFLARLAINVADEIAHVAVRAQQLRSNVELGEDVVQLLERGQK